MSSKQIALVCVAVAIVVSLLELLSANPPDAPVAQSVAAPSSISSKSRSFSSTQPSSWVATRGYSSSSSSAVPSLIPVDKRLFGQEKDDYSLFTSKLPADCPDCTPLISQLTMIEADACGTHLTVEAAKRTVNNNPVFAYLVALKSVTGDDQELYQSALQAAQETVVCGDVDSWFNQFQLIINSAYGKSENHDDGDQQGLTI